MKLMGLGESEGDWLVRSIGARLHVRSPSEEPLSGAEMEAMA